MQAMTSGIVHFSVDVRELTRLEQRLTVMPGLFLRAAAEGLNDGGDKVRTKVQRALKVQTGVKLYRSITSRMQASGRGFARASAGNLTYQIIATGKGIPISEFAARRTGRGISAPVWGVDHRFKRSFAIAGKGVEGFRARTTSKRFPIRKLYGPALPKEMTKGKIPAVFFGAVQTDVVPAIGARLVKAFG